MASYYLPNKAKLLCLAFQVPSDFNFQDYLVYTSPSVLVSTWVLELNSPNATFAPVISFAYENRQAIFFFYDKQRTDAHKNTID